MKSKPDFNSTRPRCDLISNLPPTLLPDYPTGEWISDVKFTYVKNEKGGFDLRLHNGFRFSKEMKTKDGITWVCLQNKNKGSLKCGVRVTVDNGNRLKFSKSHNHKPSL